MPVAAPTHDGSRTRHVQVEPAAERAGLGFIGLERRIPEDGIIPAATTAWGRAGPYADRLAVGIIDWALSVARSWTSIVVQLSSSFELVRQWRVSHSRGARSNGRASLRAHRSAGDVLRTELRALIDKRRRRGSGSVSG
jgi:hypothetical protein